MLQKVEPNAFGDWETQVNLYYRGVNIAPLGNRGTCKLSNARPRPRLFMPPPRTTFIVPDLPLGMGLAFGFTRCAGNSTESFIASSNSLLSISSGVSGGEVIALYMP